MDIEGSVPKAKMPKIKELKVLDAKSAQNICEYPAICNADLYLLCIALLLGSLRMPYKEVRTLVVSVDDRLTEQMVEQLSKYMPKREEVCHSSV